MKTNATSRIASTQTSAADPQLDAVAARMARLLLELEDDTYADARDCPFCVAPETPHDLGRLAHARDCELDATLREAGLRGRGSAEVARIVQRTRPRALRARFRAER